jgi:flagellar protein FliS
MNEAYEYSTSRNSNLSSYLQQKILSASPLELVAMLYSRAINEIVEARRHLANRNIELRSKAICNASEAVCELDGSLDMAAGGELSLRLRGLYRYSLVRLLDANRQQADEPLAEVLGLMATLAEAWQTISQTGQSSEPVDQKAAPRWDAESAANRQSHLWTL